MYGSVCVVCDLCLAVFESSCLCVCVCVYAVFIFESRVCSKITVIKNYWVISSFYFL